MWCECLTLIDHGTVNVKDSDAKRNCVFRSCRKEDRDSAEVMFTGSAFQATKTEEPVA